PRGHAAAPPPSPTIRCGSRGHASPRCAAPGPEDGHGALKPAAHALFKKLKDEELELLVQAVESRGAWESGCVWAPRGDPRGAKQALPPQVLLCRLYRWPDLRQPHELKHLSYCQSAGGRGGCGDAAALCCNPHHFSRLAVPGECPPSSPPQSHPSSIWSLEWGALGGRGACPSSSPASLSPQRPLRPPTRSLPSAPPGRPSPSTPSSWSSATTAWTGAVRGSDAVPRNWGADLGGSNGTRGSCRGSQPRPGPLPRHSCYFWLCRTPRRRKRCPRGHTQCFTLARSATCPHGIGRCSARHQRFFSPPTDTSLSRSTIRDGYWCKLAYWEHRTRVGRLYAVHEASVNVFCELPWGSGFCLGQLPAAHRSQAVRRARGKIGRGLLLSREPGGVWAYNRSEHPIFVSSPTLGPPGARGLAVLKVLPGYSVKVFDYERAGGLAGWRHPGDGPCDTHSVRISFGKGWGPCYSRQFITSCPCWLEVLLNQPR
uniref:Mothers against decapentaplegic homolog n=1 Tax=Anser brachyrhynchus TaxID=132585 RepID=A0A8B9IBE9_9AVES